jgi:PadR family transcriptional regulator, regulatory protein AphA
VSLQHILLGILKDEPLSGYDLNKFFQFVMSYMWPTEQSQIYRALYKMHELGWVEIEYVVQDENPNKKIYHLTDAGREELVQWLKTPHDYSPSRQAWLAQLFFADELPADDLIVLLKAHFDYMRAGLEVLEQRGSLQRALERAEEGMLQRDRLVRAMTLDYGIRRYQFEMEWAQDMMRFVEDHMNGATSDKATLEEKPDTAPDAGSQA